MPEKPAGIKSLMAVITVVIIIGASVLIYYFNNNSGYPITPPCPTLIPTANELNYTVNISMNKFSHPNPDINWLNLNSVGLVLTDRGYGTWTSEIYSNPDDSSNLGSGVLVNFVNSSENIVYFDHDLDNKLSTDDQLILKGELATTIKSINENASDYTEVVCLNLLFVDGFQNGLNKQYIFLAFCQFTD